MTPQQGATDATHRRIVVFTGDLSYSVRCGIVRMNRSLEGLSWLVLVHSPRKRVPQLFRSQWRNLKRNGWRWIPYQSRDLWNRLARPPALSEPADLPGTEFTPRSFGALANVRVERVADIHGPDAIDLVRDYAPHLGLALAAPILRRPLFSLPVAGTLNLHKGRVPDYRGMPPAFWELWNGESSVGCTVHWVDEKLDTGAVAARAKLDRQPFSTLKSLQLQLDEVGNDLVRSAAVGVLEGTISGVPQLPGGHTYRKPTLHQFAMLDRRLAASRPSSENGAKAVLKATLGAGTRLAWRAGLHRTLAPRITVLLYHRVTDTARDNLSIGIEQFDRQLALLRQHCEVLSLAEVLATSTIARSSRPLVCVTFDDGYLDNFEHAVPALLRHRVPASFFVSTGIVGTDRPFPHDVRRKNGSLPTMNWDQLRKMRSEGFMIGSHTVNHVDCVSEPEAVVWEELTRSRDTLRQELGLTDVVLGYPYGGRQHMNPARLDLVRQAGYVGCLSAYGGSNLRRVERFNVLRRGIHWGFSDQAFMRECVGLG